jgi:1-deoxy-D-xylulose-5-phosphate reductoisomerase
LDVTTKKIALLGSTGSVGRQTLDVVRQFPEQLEIVALAAGSNQSLLSEQIAEFRPRFVSAECDLDVPDDSTIEYGHGVDGLLTAATLPDVDIVVVATSGHAAILPTLRAIEHGKTIALANKEAIVCAGAIIAPEARRRNVEIRPVDSEHSAIWQCLHGLRAGPDVARVTLTASGGPFLNLPLNELAHVSVDQALAHPNWNMGAKITIDSATLMNKGLEVIEAHWLFDLPYEQIAVITHPQSVVHSLVSFQDGSVLAQFGVHDMRLPIQYALTYPERAPAPHLALDLASLGTLDFQEPDLKRFPSLAIARQAGNAGGTYPAVLSGADEIAVHAFMAGEIGFLEIANIVEAVLDVHTPQYRELTLDVIAEADEWSRRQATTIVRNLRRDI